MDTQTGQRQLSESSFVMKDEGTVTLDFHYLKDDRTFSIKIHVCVSLFRCGHDLSVVTF